MMERLQNIDLLAVITHGIIALIFATVKQVNDLGKQGFNKLKFITGMVVGSFVGVATYFLCQDLIPSTPYLVAFFTSIAGWAGGNLMDFFSDMLQRTIERKLNTVIDKDNGTTDTLSKPAKGK